MTTKGRKPGVKTIDIQAKEWFDRVNGNSYFSARVTVNYQLKGEQVLTIPFQYGYGDSYIQESMKTLIDKGIIKDAENHKYGNEAIWNYARRKQIVLRYNKQANCTKKECKNFGE